MIDNDNQPPTAPITLPAMVASMKARAHYTERARQIIASASPAGLTQDERAALDLLERAHNRERSAAQ